MDLRDAERALFTLDPDPGNVDIFWLDCLALNERFCACREQPTVRHITAEKKTLFPCSREARVPKQSRSPPELVTFCRWGCQSSNDALLEPGALLALVGLWAA